MTNNEYKDLYDSMYFGHDAELSLNGKEFFLEHEDDNINIYLINEEDSLLISSFRNADKNILLNELFEAKIFEGRNLNSDYKEINIIDIE